MDVPTYVYIRAFVAKIGHNQVSKRREFSRLVFQILRCLQFLCEFFLLKIKRFQALFDFPWCILLHISAPENHFCAESKRQFGRRPFFFLFFLFFSLVQNSCSIAAMQR